MIVLLAFKFRCFISILTCKIFNLKTLKFLFALSFLNTSKINQLTSSYLSVIKCIPWLKISHRDSIFSKIIQTNYCVEQIFLLMFPFLKFFLPKYRKACILWNHFHHYITLIMQNTSSILINSHIIHLWSKHKCS